MHPVSYSRITNIVGSIGIKIGKSTIIEYLEHLKDTWLVFSLSNIIAKMAERESNKKYYFADNGILNLFLFDGETALLENLVAIELKKKYGDELFFYNSNVEIDFIIPEQQRAVQVSYSIADEATKQREVRALVKLAELYNLKKLEIVTYDEETSIQETGMTISVIPVWKWLLTI